MQVFYLNFYKYSIKYYNIMLFKHKKHKKRSSDEGQQNSHGQLIGRKDHAGEQVAKQNQQSPAKGARRHKISVGRPRNAAQNLGHKQTHKA